MRFVYDDGGRKAAGYKGNAGDCVARSVAIATGRPYAEVYAALADGTSGERRSKRAGKAAGRRTAREGIITKRKWFKDYMASLGWRWVPTMGIGTGCTVHLTDGELPMGRLVVSLSKHYTAVIDGEVHDTHNPQREICEMGPYDAEAGRNPILSVRRRCVYGYWIQA